MSEINLANFALIVPALRHIAQIECFIREFHSQGKIITALPALNSCESISSWIKETQSTSFNGFTFFVSSVKTGKIFGCARVTNGYSCSVRYSLSPLYEASCLYGQIASELVKEFCRSIGIVELLVEDSLGSVESRKALCAIGGSFDCNNITSNWCLVKL